MYYILVHAVFKNAEEHRADIYECLEKKGWKKLTDHHISTIWRSNSVRKVCKTVDELESKAELDFKGCIKPFKKVEVHLICHAGVRKLVSY